MEITDAKVIAGRLSKVRDIMNNGVKNGDN